MKKIEFFKIEGDRINRFRRHCPKCGPGLFLADHNNRFSCGKCGYTEFKVGSRKEPQPPKVEEKPIEQPVQEQKKQEITPKPPIEETLKEEQPVEEKPVEEVKPINEPTEELNEEPTEKETSDSDKQPAKEKKENTSESKEKPDEK